MACTLVAGRSPARPRQDHQEAGHRNIKTCGGVGVVAEAEKLVRTTSWFPPRPVRPLPRPLVELVEEVERRELKFGRYNISNR